MLHSRLSIIDTSNKSNQPFCDKFDNALSFNGEIYNYLELKNKLKQKINFTTTGDTEVLFNLLKNYGIESINQCEGMWGVVYYDSKKTLFI